MANRILVPAPGKDASEGNLPRPAVASAWKALAVFGLMFLVAGAIDIALALVPPNFGSPEWRFARFAGVVGGLPILVLGLVALVWSASNLNSRGVRVLSFVGSALVATLIAFSLIVVATSWGEAKAAVPAEAVAGAARALARTVMLGLVFLAAAGYALTLSLRGLRRDATE